jgi:hypothetical protein
MPNWKKLITSGSDAYLNSLNVSENVIATSFTGSLFGSASYALTASFTTANSEAFGYYFTQSSAASSWVITHNLSTFTPLVQVYDTAYKAILPKEIINTSSIQTIIQFDYNQAGYAVVSKGDGITTNNIGTSSFAINSATASYIDGGFY